MAIADLGGSVAERPVELLLGDHRNDVTEAASIARRWYGQDGVDVVISGVNSDTSLALTSVAAEVGKPILIVGAGTSVQTRERPAPGVIQYAYDTVALATVPGLVLTQKGDKRWFYITADYPFGRELEAHGRAAVTGAGGTVVGSVLNPHEADDFTPYVQAALDSGAQALGLANGHAELIKAMAAMQRMHAGMGVGEACEQGPGQEPFGDRRHRQPQLPARRRVAIHRPGQRRLDIGKRRRQRHRLPLMYSRMFSSVPT